MRNILLIIFLIIQFNDLCFSQIKGGNNTYVDVLMMNYDIKHTVKEHDRQKDMKSNEDKNLGLELINKEQWEKLEDKVKKIQKRLSVVDVALQAIPLGSTIVEKTKTIKDNETQILNEIQELPLSLVVVLKQEVNFIYNFQMTLRLIVGIVASVGAINQMEKAERKIIMNYAIQEVEKLEKESFSMLYLIRDFKSKMKQQGGWTSYINQDKLLVEEIINKIHIN